MVPAAPNAFASQFVPENTDCSAASVAFCTDASAPRRWVMKMIGAAPTDTVVGLGIAVLVKGSVPLMLKAIGWAVAVLPGEPLRMSVPWSCASVAPKLGQTPEAFVPYPRPASPSAPPPSVELIRH